MKKLLFIFSLLMTALTASSQVLEPIQPIGAKTTTIQVRGSMIVDSFMFLPIKVPVNIARLYRAGHISYQISDSSLYMWTGNQFLKVQAGGAGGVTNLSAGTNTANTFTIANSNGTAVTIPPADGILAGLVPAVKYQAWDAKLDQVNLGRAQTPTNFTITSSAGASTIIPAVDNVNAGLMTPPLLAALNAKLSSVLTANSIINTGVPGSAIQLVNDQSSPGANKTYGTDALGVKGFKPDPGGVGGGSSEVIQTTFSAFDASSGLATNKIYKVTDAGRYGDFKYIGTVADQSLDNGGTIIINAGLQRFDRMYSGALDMRWFGLNESFTQPAGAYAAPTGTDQKALFDKVVAAAASNQEITCEGCSIYINSNLAPFSGSKVVNLRINGTIYMGAGCDTLFHTKNASGDHESHRIYIERIIGRTGIPLNGPGARAAGTSPNWNNLTGTVLLIDNSFKGKYWFNRVWGVKTVVEVFGDVDGSQENTIDGTTWYDIANHILFRSGDGSSYCDKTKIGWSSVLRTSGGLIMHFDGGPGNTGAIRSIKVDLMVEHADSLLLSHADVTEPVLLITPEGGTTTNFYGDPIISIANTFRSAYWGGAGVFRAKDVGGINMGQSGMIVKPIWNVTYKVGDRHIINGDGSLTTIKENNTISNANMTALQTSYPTWKFTTQDGELEKAISTTYSIASWDRWIKATGTSYTVTFPSTTLQAQRLVTIKNSASGTLTISGVTGITSIPTGQVMTYRSFQSGGWESVGNLSGAAGGGTATAVAFVNTPDPRGLTDNGAGGISATPANLTNPGSLNVGAQVMPSGTKTFDGVGIQGASFGVYNFIGRQNGMSWNDNSTPNASSTILTAVNWGSGDPTKDIVFGIGKTSVNWVGFGNNGTDFMLLAEKTTGGWEFRNNSGYAALTLAGGNLRGKIFGSSGNWLVQSGGTAIDAGYKFDVQGTLRATGSITNTLIAAPVGLSYMVTVDENGVYGSETKPTGGSGGSTIFTAGSGTGTPYYRLFPVNIGVNPAQSWAWTHWGPSCLTCGPSSTARAIWEFSSTSAYVGTPRQHSVDYNGVYLRLTPNTGVPGRVVTENNGLTIAGSAHFEGADIEPQFIDRETSALGDNFISNGIDGSTWRAPNYELKLSAGAAKTITASTEIDMLGSTIGSTTPEAIPTGSYYKFTSRGTLTTTGTTSPTVRFVCGNFNESVILNSVPIGTSSEFSLEFVITKQNTTTHWEVTLRIDNGSLNFMRKIEGETGVVLSSSGSATQALWTWGTTGQSVTFSSGTWELFRLQ